MLAEWHKDFFTNLEQNPIDQEGFAKFTDLFKLVFSELDKELTSLKNSENEIDRERYREYQSVLTDWHGYKKRILKRKDTHYGYQLHLAKRLFLVDFFRVMESFEVIQNNFGDIQDISDIDIPEDPNNLRVSGNNYAMDTKSLEWDIIRLLAENFGLPKQPRLVEFRQNPHLYQDGYWGYVTTGGSESNMWAIIQGFTQYPNGVLYYSEGAHYSVPKAAKNHEIKVIPQISADNDAINVELLIAEIKANWEAHKKPAIIVLTIGTTKCGAVDDVGAVKKHLRELDIPHYIHADAAFYGGIPKNQEFAPKIGSIEDWGYDSIAISMHKYIGYPAAKGVLISTKKPVGNFIDYIGQEDNTVLGSRDVPAFSLRQQVTEVLRFSTPMSYIRNINTFENMLNDLGVTFTLWTDGVAKGCIFVFKVNKEVQEYKDICKHWQLSEFVGIDDLHRVHIVIFPSHSDENMELLSKDLSKIAVK